MGAIWKLTKKDIKNNKIRNLILFLVLVISIATFTGIGILYEGSKRGMANIIQKEQGYYDIKTVNKLTENSNKKGLSNLDQANELKNLQTYYIYDEIQIKDLANKRHGQGELLLYNPDEKIQEQKYPEQSLFVLKDGTYPTNDNQVIIGSSTNLESISYKIGDKISLLGKEFEVVGIAKTLGLGDGFITIMPKNFASNLDLKAYEKNGVEIQTAEFKNIYGNISQIVENAQKQGNTQVDVAEIKLALVDANYAEAKKQIAFLEIIKNVLIVIVAIISILIVYNLVNISVIENKKQYGILKSLGITNTKLYIYVLIQALIIAAAAFVVGILGGMLGDKIVIDIINSKIAAISQVQGFGIDKDFSIPFVFNFDIIWLVLVATLITIIIATLKPAVVASLTSPMEVIRQSAEYKIKGGKVKTSKTLKRIFGIEADIARKNMKRSSKKFRLAVISLVLSFLLVFLVINITAVFKDQIKNAKGTLGYVTTPNTYVGHLYIDTKYEPGENTPDPQTVALEENNLTEPLEKLQTEKIKVKNNIPTKEFVETALAQIEHENPKLKITSANFEERLEPEYTTEVLNLVQENLTQDGKDRFIGKNGKINIAVDIKTAVVSEYLPINEIKDLKDNEVLIPTTENILKNDKYQDYKLIEDSLNGKKIKLNTVDGEKEYTIKLASNPDFYRSEMYSNIPRLPIFVNFNQYDKIMKAQNTVYNGNIIISNKSEVNLSNKTFDVTNNNEKLQIFGLFESGGLFVLLNNIADIVLLLVTGFIVLMILISILNIFITITIQLILRRREFAILQSVGMSDRQFRKMLRVENYILILKGVLWGTLWCFLILYLIYKFALKGEGLATFFTTVNYPAYIISIVVAALIVFISSRIASKTINDFEVVDVIKSQNL